jgi:hypothetical protein
VGHDAAGENLAALYSLIATCAQTRAVGLSRSAASTNSEEKDGEARAARER